MIKLIMTVDYENETQDDLVRAINANKAYLAISEIQKVFRRINKYGYFENHDLEQHVLDYLSPIFEKLESKIYEIIEDFLAKY